MSQEFRTPAAIEGESMRIIAHELSAMGVTLPPDRAGVVLRCIHTTADFDYAKNLAFTPGAVERGIAALRQGTMLFTDTNMALAGVNKKALAQLGVDIQCFMADPQVADRARELGVTRAAAAADRWAQVCPGAVCAVGNAPTALLRMEELILAGRLRPALVVGVPVGFVNVVESKQRILDLARERDIPAIVALGRKGGSTVAAAICNALLYQAVGRTL